MEKSTVIGITLGVLAVGVGMVLKGASISVLVNPAAILIIIVGTIATIFNGFPMDEIKRIPELTKKLFKKQDYLHQKSDIIDLFVALSQTARREGILALESKLDEIEDPFLKTALQMVIDGMDPTFVEDVLDAEVKVMEERHYSGAMIFAQAGMYAPTLGVLGAVIGLIAALGNLNDIEQLGHSIAAAFVATLLGIFTGYVLWHPFSNKLKMLSKSESEIKQMLIEAILSLQAGDSPVAIETKLTVFIPQKEREQLKKLRKTKDE